MHIMHDQNLVALHRSQAWEASSALLYTIDRTFRIVTANPAWESFTDSYKGPHALREYTVGANLLEVMPDHIRPDLEPACHRIFGAELERYESEHDYGGAKLPCHMKTVVTPLLGKQQTVEGAIFTHHDITPLAQLRAEASAEHARAQTLSREWERIQHLAIALVATDDRTKLIDHIVRCLSGAIPDAHVALLLRDPATGQYLPHNASHAAQHEFTALLAVIAPLIAQLEARTALHDVIGYHRVPAGLVSSAETIGSVYLHPLRSHDESLHGTVVCWWPTPHRLTALEHQLLNSYVTYALLALQNAALFQAEVATRIEVEHEHRVATDRSAQLSAMIEVLDDGVVLCHRDGHITVANRAVANILNPEAIATGTPLSELPARLNLPAPLQQLGLDQALAGTPVSGETVIPLHGEDHTISISTRPIYDAAGPIAGAVALVRDVTLEKRRAQVRDEFLSVAAHELKTPVTTLKGYAQLALKRLSKQPGDEPIQRALKTIDMQADRITRIVGELLDVVRLQSGLLDLNVARFDLVEVIRVVVSALSKLDPFQDITINGELHAFVDADIDRIEQVIRNVLRHISRYATPGSAIAIRVTGGAMVEVIMAEHDASAGPETMERLFDAHHEQDYPRLDTPENMNLRLNLTQEVLHRLGGYLWIEAGPDLPIRVGWSVPAANNTGHLRPGTSTTGSSPRAD
ncbi:MAG: hypothetical protein NVS4B8_29210 [Herpetosiphon sp.]